jgi:hypothetical protein
LLIAEIRLGMIYNNNGEPFELLLHVLGFVCFVANPCTLNRIESV